VPPQAAQYRMSKDEEQLYVMLMRFLRLVLETIPDHQDYRKANPDRAYEVLRQHCKSQVVPEMERLRPSLETKRIAEEPFTPTKSPGTVQHSAGRVPGLHWDGTAGTAGTATTAAVSAPVPSAQPALFDVSMGIKLPPASQAALSKHSLSPAYVLSPPLNSAPSEAQQPVPQQHASMFPELESLDVPSVPPQPSAPPLDADFAALGITELATPSPYAQVQLGPQELGVQSASYPELPPSPNASCCASDAVATVPQGGVSEVKRRQKMRDVHVSAALMDEFLRYAISNTRRGIESCGILAGTLSANDATFTITALIVPKQHGTSDTVQALAEEEIFEVQDKRALYPLGWIHTHPTQTCFLSSIDVHTHCGYQTMLDEAVAIVMAPLDPRNQVGIFRLSTPGGLKLVQRCPHRGFHAHPPTDTGQPVYELCGHVYLNPRVGFDVIDLR
jgi:STAM-binding protein